MRLVVTGKWLVETCNIKSGGGLAAPNTLPRSPTPTPAHTHTIKYEKKKKKKKKNESKKKKINIFLQRLRVRVWFQAKKDIRAYVRALFITVLHKDWPKSALRMYFKDD